MRMKKWGFSVSKKTTDIVCYLSPVGFILAFLLGDRTFSRFHMNQSLVLILTTIILEILGKVSEYIPLLGLLVQIILAFLNFVVFLIWLSAIWSAIQGREKPMAILGGIHLM